MKKIKLFLIIFTFLFVCFSFAEPAINEIDPERLLSDMADVMIRSKTIRYSARHEYLGERAAVWAAISGDVLIKKFPGEETFNTKMALSIETHKRESDETIQNVTSFNGRTVTVKDEVSKKITETVFPESTATLTAVSRLISGNSQRLLLWEFILPSSSQPTLVQYDGQVAVNSVLCDVVYTEREYDYFDRKRKTMKRWFIGIEDKLPRRVESYSISEEGRVSADSLTVSGLEIDNDIPDSVFEISAAAGYTQSTQIYSTSQTEQKPLLNISEKAPDWTLFDAEGREVSLSQYRGKIVVMDFWAVWCGPCRVLMPALQKIHDRFKDRDVFVVGIDSPMGVKGETARAPQYMKNMDYTYTVLLEGDATAKAYQVSSLPTLYIVGADGQILYRGVGVEGEGEKPSEIMQAYYDKLAEIIEKELKKIE